MARSLPSTILLAGALASAILAGCGADGGGAGDASPSSTSSTTAADGVDAEWTVTMLEGTSNAESEPQLAVDGDTVLAVMSSDDGRVTSAIGEGGGELEAGTPLDTGIEPLWLSATARGEDGWLVLATGGTVDVDGDEQLSHEPQALRSSDGKEWELVDVTGFGGAADLTEVVAVDGGFVAGGNRRLAEDPSSGGFVATAWASDDGETWTEVQLPDADEGDSAVHGLVVTGDRVVAVGASGAAPGHGMVWTSDDGGATWERRTPTGFGETSSISHLAVTGDRVVASGMDGDRQVLATSDDAGETWQRRDGMPSEGSEPGAFPLTGGGDGRVFTQRSVLVAPWDDPAVCYADLEQCRGGAEEAPYESVDGGETWERLDTSVPGGDEYSEVWSLLSTASGTTVAMQSRPDGIAVVTWPAGVPLPRDEEPTTKRADVTMLAEGEEPEPGVRYAAPLYVHCGMDWLYLGDEPWKRTDDGTDVETGAGEQPDPSWPMAGQTIFGFATLGDDGVVEYSIGDEDGAEVIASYEQVDEPPPPCM